MAIVLYTLGLSMNAISKLFGVSAYSVPGWVRIFAIASCEKPIPEDAIIVEFDEMWIFLASEQNISGYGKLFAEKLANSSIGNVVAVIKRSS